MVEIVGHRFHKALPRDSFKIFFGKDVVLYEIHSKKIEGDEYLCPWTVVSEKMKTVLYPKNVCCSH
jgi:hypothetical protein